MVESELVKSESRGRCRRVNDSGCLSCVTVSLGMVPTESALAGVPQLEASGGSGGGEGETPAARVAKQVSSLMALLTSREALDAPSKASKVWLGEGLGSISKRTYDRMIRWEFVDMGDLRQSTAVEKMSLEADTQRLVVLPGFEVSQARQRPVSDIITWVHCFGRYTAAMAQKFPCASGFMSHLLTVLKAYTEVEEPAWRLYDVAYREKMAAMGLKSWSGMDVQLYQEVCGGRPRRKATPQADMKGAAGTSNPKRPGEGRRPAVCWQFNDGGCTFGRGCKFPHACEICRGGHPKCRCPSMLGPGKKQRLS